MKLFSTFVLIACMGPAIAYAQIMPHKAEYQISLVKKGAGEGLVDATGSINFELHHTCTQWKTNHHSDIQYYYNNGRHVQADSHYSSIESMDGQTITFANEEKANKRLEHFSRGIATQKGHDFLDVQYNNGTGIQSKKMDGAFVFPIYHTKKLIEYAKSNKFMYHTKLYDGGHHAPYHITNAVIGPIIQKHGKPDSWPVSMAFYNPANDYELPAYEMHFEISNNGVVHTMDIVYPQFTVRQTLIDLKLLEKQPCD